MWFAVIILIIVMVIYYKQKKPKIRKIILLSSARCNGTIILRYLGQRSNTKIINEYFTRYFDDVKSVSHDNKSFRTHKIVDLEKLAIAYENEGADMFVTHEMANDLTIKEMKLLILRGWECYIIKRNPCKQLASLLDLKNSGASDEVIIETIRDSWNNLKEYKRQFKIKRVIDSTLWCNCKEFRKELLRSMNIKYDEKYETLEKYYGDEFHNICYITKNVGNNPWNGKAATSKMILEDNRNYESSDNDEIRNVLLPAISIYAVL